MTKYNYGQLEALWIQNGGSPTTAPMAAAIAMAESGGDSTSHSGTNDFGLWQINNGGPALYDPNRNAQRAIAMSNNGQNWRPWCTAYNDSACGTRGGAYLGPKAPFWKFLSGQAPAGGALPTGPPGGAPGGADATLTGAGGNTDCPPLFSLSSPLKGLPGSGVLGLDGTTTLLNKCQGRALLGAACVAAGGLMMVVGFGFVLAGTKTGKQVLQVTSLVPGGGALSAAGRAAGSRGEKRGAAAAEKAVFGEARARGAENRRAYERTTGQRAPRQRPLSEEGRRRAAVRRRAASMSSAGDEPF